MHLLQAQPKLSLEWHCELNKRICIDLDNFKSCISILCSLRDGHLYILVFEMLIFKGRESNILHSIHFYLLCVA